MFLTFMSPVVVNGLDITDLIADRGLAWSLRYVHGSNEGVTLAGVTQLDIIAEKKDLEVECLPLSYSQLAALLAALSPPSFPVTYDDPQDGYTTKTMHAVDQSALFLREMPGRDGVVAAYWDGISFKLEEL